MTEYVFVNDFFAEELTGGAELTSQSLIDVCNHKIHKIKSINITDSLVENLKELSPDSCTACFTGRTKR